MGGNNDPHRKEIRMATIKFKCGCFVCIYQDEVGEQMGLACCQKHEAPNQKLENLGQIEVESVKIQRPFNAKPN